MRVLVRRRLTIDEIMQKIRAYREKYGSIDAVRSRAYSEGIKSKIWDIYAEWYALQSAYQSYEEDGEFFYVVEEEISPDIARRILSPKMVELVRQIAIGVDSISDLARKLGRSVSNVYKDLRFLADIGIVELYPIGRRKKPYLLAEEIVVEFLSP